MLTKIICLSFELVWVVSICYNDVPGVFNFFIINSFSFFVIGTFPGPGDYNPDRSLFGPVLLKEGGGTVSRPGKPSTSSASEGSIPGQHVAASNAQGYTKPHPKLVSEVLLTTGGETRKLTGTWHKSSSKGQHYSSPYSINTKKQTHTIYHNAGRITEATVSEYPNCFRGRASAGSFMRFPATRAATK